MALSKREFEKIVGGAHRLSKLTASPDVRRALATAQAATDQLMQAEGAARLIAENDARLREIALGASQVAHDISTREIRVPPIPPSGHAVVREGIDDMSAELNASLLTLTGAVENVTYAVKRLADKSERQGTVIIWLTVALFVVGVMTVWLAVPH